MQSTAMAYQAPIARNALELMLVVAQHDESKTAVARQIVRKAAHPKCAHLALDSEPPTPSAASMSVWLMAPCSIVSAIIAAAHFS